MATHIYDNSYSTSNATIRQAEQQPAPAGLLQQGRGPDRCSTSQELALSPQICWDVCRYYRRLGLHWKATRKEIRHALHELKATVGAGKPDLIYAAKQLLDETIRREYDRVPLGMLFLKDKDVVALLKRAAQQAASAMAARGFHQTPEDVLGSWGFNVNPPTGPGGGGEKSQAPAASLPSLLRATARWHSQWSWYYDPVMLNHPLGWREERLEEWQHLLVSAFARRGLRAQFAVGLCDAETFSVRPVPNAGILVILLGSGEPSPELAADAVDVWGLIQQTQSQGDMHATLGQRRRQG